MLQQASGTRAVTDSPPQGGPAAREWPAVNRAPCP